MEVHRVILNRTQLAAMPESERVLLLLLAYASNEINVLSKLILMMRKDDSPSPIHDAVETGQIFILMRLLIGKLHEAWELFKNRVQSDRSITTTHIPRLPPEAAAALEALKRHFGAGSALSKIRNKISFHYSDKENLTEASFQQLPQSEPINSASAEARAFEALCGEIIEVSRDISELFGHLIAMLTENIVDSMVTEQVTDGPKMSTFLLPYFFDEDDALPAQPRETLP